LKKKIENFSIKKKQNYDFLAHPVNFQTRTAYDYVPTAAMTTISYCSSGSTRGYDEFVPFLVDVVHEDRLYSKWSDISNSPEKQGMIRARKLFNDLHANLSLTGYSEVRFHHAFASP
jgi:glycogen debranching enzyme